jgi:transposase
MPGLPDSPRSPPRRANDAGIEVLEVDRPDRSERRRKGKDDDLDAISAARAALHDRRTSTPKSKDGAVESPRVTRATAIRAQRNAPQLLRVNIVSAPEELRDQLRHLTRMQLIRTRAGWRPDTTNATDPVSATRIALNPWLAGSSSSATRSPCWTT